METIIKAIASSGVNVVVTGAAVGEMALHFLNRHNIMVVKAPSKFDIRRLCETCAATPLGESSMRCIACVLLAFAHLLCALVVRLGAPTPDEIGTCDSVQVRLIGSTQVVVFEQSEARSQIATIILRGATQNQLDDVERAIDDGVNVYKQMTKQADFVVGAGAAEMEIARQLQTFSESIPGLDQFSTRRFGEAFEVVPRTLGETSGANVLELITTMYAQHATNPHIGINVDNEGSTHDAKEARIWDLYATKHNAIRLAVDTALTVLRVDSIIMYAQCATRSRLHARIRTRHTLTRVCVRSHLFRAGPRWLADRRSLSKMAPELVAATKISRVFSSANEKKNKPSLTTNLCVFLCLCVCVCN